MTERNVASPGEETGTTAAIPVLLIGFRNAPSRRLRSILAAPLWEIREAPTCGQAARMLAGGHVGVAICDIESGGDQWRSLLAELEESADAPNLIISSRLADERLWAEVLNLGGYDLLVEPFDQTEVLRVTHMAWEAWRARCRGLGPQPNGSLRMRAAS